MPKKNNVFAHYPWIESKKRFRVRVRIGEQEHAITGKSPDEIDEKYATMMEAHEAGLVLNDTTTVAQYIKKWFPVKMAGMSHSHTTNIRAIANNHIAPSFGNMRLRDVKPLHIQAMLADRQHLSHSHLSKILIYTRQLFDSALDNGLILRNPCDKIAAAGKPSIKRGILSERQTEELLEAIKDTRALPFVAIAVYTGMRREEICGLQWDCVHLDGNAPYIEVRRAVHFEGNRGVINDTLKSKAAYRNIPIPQILVAILRDVRNTSSSFFVIPAADGQHMSLMAYRRIWEVASKRVPFRITPHMLRHTYVTKLCDSGMDIKKIQYLAGHSKVELTLNIYTHAINNRPDELTHDIVNIFDKGSREGSAANVKA